MSNIRYCLGQYTKDKYASSLRAAQNRQWAAKHVHLGIKHFKSGNKIEAFQSLNQALNIDPKNVEGLVARGNEPFLNWVKFEVAKLDFPSIWIRGGEVLTHLRKQWV